MTSPVETALARSRRITLIALALLTLLAWGWLVRGAGMAMAPQAWLPLSPHAAPGAMAGTSAMADMPGMAVSGPAAWSTPQLFMAITMWWVMMVAMMVPAAAPVILLYARAGGPGSRPATGPFLAGYLIVWGLFACVAALLQDALQGWTVLSPITMSATANWFFAGILVLAGLYQLSPFKEQCLAHCRNPAQFLARHYRPGPRGALRMGLAHGTFCLGCCWLLMALLFVGGVMNLAWIALLTLLVASEKLLPGGRRVGQAAGIAFIAWGALVALR